MCKTKRKISQLDKCIYDNEQFNTLFDHQMHDIEQFMSDLLREFRQHCEGLTQSYVAGECGINERTLYKIENGTCCPIDTYIRVWLYYTLSGEVFPDEQQRKLCEILSEIEFDSE